MSSNFFKMVAKTVAYVEATIFLKLIEIANISYSDNLIIESLKCLMVSDICQCLYLTSDLA